MDTGERACPTTSDVVPGSVLGRYEVVRPIARGGMGQVYLGRARGPGGFGRPVAIKVCHPMFRGDPDFEAMFFDEARLAGHIAHPNVVATIDVGIEPCLHLVMEYVDGASLRELMRVTDGPLPPACVVRILLDLLRGLHAAHQATDAEGQPLRIVHRDISPHNVLVGKDGIARVTDFGIAKAESRLSLTREGQFKGKARYMAPELVSGGAASCASDLFSAAVVAWEALTGESLFVGSSPAEVFGHLLYRPIPTLASCGITVTSAFEEVLGRALARDPSERYSSCSAFIAAIEASGMEVASSEALGAFVETRTTLIVSPEAPAVQDRSTVAGPRSRRRPIALASSLVIGVAVLLLAAAWLRGVGSLDEAGEAAAILTSDERIEGTLTSERAHDREDITVAESAHRTDGLVSPSFAASPGTALGSPDSPSPAPKAERAPSREGKRRSRESRAAEESPAMPSSSLSSPSIYNPDVI